MTMTTPRTTECAFCGEQNVVAPHIHTYVTCPSCSRSWFGRLRSGGFSSQQLDAITLMTGNGLVLPVIPAYLSVLEFQLSIEVRDFLRDCRPGTYYATLAGAAKQSYEDGVECFLTRADTNQLLAVIACMSDIHCSAAPLLTHHDSQLGFDTGYASLARNVRQPRTFVSNLPGDYRSTGTTAAHGLHHFMVAEFEQKHSKPPATYSRYEDARTMRNRIVHGDFRPVTSQSGWVGMTSFTPGHVSQQHTDFVRDAVADVIDYLTMLHYALL